MSKGAFHRVGTFFAAVFAAAALPDLVQRKEALSKIGQYKSRGHGLGLPGNKHSHRCVAHDKRAARKKRNCRK